MLYLDQDFDLIADIRRRRHQHLRDPGPFAKSGDASTKFEVGANVDDKANPPRRVEANRLLVKVPACLRQGATSW